MTLTSELHLKYAPIMHFARGEGFLPMQVTDFLPYSALHVKGHEKPIVPEGRLTAAQLVQDRGDHETFVRSVGRGPFDGFDVARTWSVDTLRLLYAWATTPTRDLSESAAKAAYQWLSNKTRPAARRFWWNALLSSDAENKIARSPSLPRFRLPGDVRQSALERYQTSQAGYAYYYRTTEEQGFLNLQYWFFYAFNDWANAYGGFNDHEGDWEGFQIFFKLEGGRPVEPPAYVTYLGHHSRMTKPWAHADVEKVDTHPLVYVAAGSHAGYPNARQYPLVAIYKLIDYATGDAMIVDHMDWQHRINIDEAPYVETYRGSWGTRYWLSLDALSLALSVAGIAAPAHARDFLLPGVSAPRGPRFDDAGDERESWRAPLVFAGIDVGT